tara:strand:- start:98 stop:352 length:255 start_codon:yes stop_codon:yes gene_type:complete
MLAKIKPNKKDIKKYLALKIALEIRPNNLTEAQKSLLLTEMQAQKFSFLNAYSYQVLQKVCLPLGDLLIRTTFWIKPESQHCQP